ASGTLAGGTGTYAATLERWIDQLEKQRTATNQAPWTTFAGNAARNRVPAVFPPARLWLDGPTWRVRLPGHRPGVPNNPADEPGGRTGPASHLAFHPLVVDSQVLIADARSVTGYQLFTGRELFRFVLPL